MKKIFVFCILLLTITGCKKETLKQYRMISFESGFDTFFTLVGYANSQEEFTEYFELLEETALHYHRLFDKYHAYEGINNIYTINQNAGIQPVKVDVEIINLLLLAKNWYNITNGLFDITFGSVLNVWHSYRESGTDLNNMGEYGEIPPFSSLEEAAQFTGWDFVEIDIDAQTVYITDARVSFDVGAIAKGYAVEKIALVLEETGLQYASISGGGNVRTINYKPDYAPWNISVKQPDSIVNQSLDILAIPHSCSAVTSGDYERYYIIEGNILLHHIIDPRTLMPTQNARSVTIVYSDSGVADILSTVLMILDFEEGVAFVNQYNAEHPDEQIGVLWVFMESQGQQKGYREIQKDGFTLYITENILELSTLFGE